MYYSLVKNSLKFFNKLRDFNIFTRQCHSLYPPWKVLFFGSDSFSVISLKHLCAEYRKGKVIKYLGIVTSSSKTNPVRRYAKDESLPLYDWPLGPLKEKFDIGLVVSFGHLIPEEIIQIFPLGMLNIHASLLPRWRGAAPIIYAIANGDNTTGISIMKIKPKKFDIGEIVSQVPVELPLNMRMPSLRDKLGEVGAMELVKCLYNLPTVLKNAVPQSSEGVTNAPKITSEFAVINWNSMSARQVYNLGRALDTLHPLLTTWQDIPVKLFGIEEYKGSTESASNILIDPSVQPGFVYYNRISRTLIVKCCDENWISVEKIGVLKKKIMSAVDFNNGFMKKVKISQRYFR